MPMPHRTFAQVAKRRLTGKEGRERIREVNALLAELPDYRNGPYADLRKWLLAMTLDMLFLGTLTGLGLYLIGVPVAFALGILSGVSVFVPYIGPIAAIVPGLLIALSVSPTLALYAAIVYLVAQQLEGNIALPLLQRWTVSMPPAVSLLAIVAFGLLFGVWGVLFATAATATLIAVQGDTHDAAHPSILSSEAMKTYVVIPWQERYERNWYALACVGGALGAWLAARFVRVWRKRGYFESEMWLDCL